MTNLIIKNEKTQDIEAIRQLNLIAFAQEVEAEIVDKLRISCSDFISFVAKDKDVSRIARYRSEFDEAV